MMQGPSDELARSLGIHGEWGEVFSVFGEHGELPAKDWLDVQPAHVRARYLLKFRRMCEQGPHRMRGEDYHPLEEKGDVKNASLLSEFKDISSQSRILCFHDGRGVVLLTHGFGGKKENKTPKREILEGLRLRELYLRRKVKLIAGAPRDPQGPARRRG